MPLNFPDPYDVEDPYDAMIVNLDDLKQKVTKHLERTLAERVFILLKKNLFDQLETALDFEVPASLLLKEIEALQGRSNELEEEDKEFAAKSEDEKEAYYHTIFHLIFTLIGTSIHSEVSVSKGRIDSVVETDNNIFIFEFKVGRTPKKAIEQIELKNYYEAYSSSKKEIILVGVNFSISKRNVKDWKAKSPKI